MSLRIYFKHTSPLPIAEETGTGASATMKRSQQGCKMVLDGHANEPGKRKCKLYTAFTDEQWANIGKYAAENGNAAALLMWKKILFVT